MDSWIRSADAVWESARSDPIALCFKPEAVLEALAGLPEDQREVLVLRHVLGLSPPEIAERLGKTESSIHGLHHRGRAALKAALIELEATPAKS